MAAGGVSCRVFLVWKSPSPTNPPKTKPPVGGSQVWLELKFTTLGSPVVSLSSGVSARCGDSIPPSRRRTAGRRWQRTHSGRRPERLGEGGGGIKGRDSIL